MTSSPRRALAAAAALALVVLASGPSRADDTNASGADLPLHLVATAVDMEGTGPTVVGTIQITIERWSTDAERKMLVDTLKEKGPDALLSAVQSIKPRAGFIRTSRSIGWDVQFAYEVPGENGGRRIIIATDRPMGFWELSRRTRSTDYGFMLAEIRLGPDGTGQGKLATAAKVSYYEPTKTIEIENYDIEPVRLQNVHVEDGRKSAENGG